jgi:hypothetical protein
LAEPALAPPPLLAPEPPPARGSKPHADRSGSDSPRPATSAVLKMKSRLVKVGIGIYRLS